MLNKRKKEYFFIKILKTYNKRVNENGLDQLLKLANLQLNPRDPKKMAAVKCTYQKVKKVLHHAEYPQNMEKKNYLT